MQESETLWVQETFVNATEHAQFGETEPWDTGCTTRGELYRDMQSEYGRCLGKCYVDTADGRVREAGWVFQSRQRYENSRDPKDTYLREVWVFVLTAPDTVTVERHYEGEVY